MEEKEQLGRACVHALDAVPVLSLWHLEERKKESERREGRKEEKWKNKERKTNVIE